MDPSQFMNWKDYEKVRMERYKQIAEIKRDRRFELGKRLTLLFENKETVIHQIQEMIYLDKLEKEDDIKREIELYSTMIPCNNLIKATLFINAWNEADLKEVFRTLRGIYNSIFLKIGDKLIQGVPEKGREQGEEFSTVQYLFFDISSASPSTAKILVLHENYREEANIPDPLLKLLFKEASIDCKKI
ncbi:fructose-bisphosphate aldolase [Sulfolobales archaeon HS-7]|nr:fructose-bisphosphate aldolase [Sulfolobales archaeon HS-7]